MKRRGLLGVLVVLLGCGLGCGGQSPTVTGTDVHVRTLSDGSVERWTVDDDGVADGEYRVETADGWLLREGAFRRGQPDGAWTDWYAPEALPSATPQRAMTYGFVAGLADGAFTAWEADGTVRWERRWAGGEPCGVWKEFGDEVRETAYASCDGGAVAFDPEALALISPLVTDFGWDGQTCPAETSLVTGRDPETGVEASASFCARGEVADGPARWLRGPSGEVAQTGRFALGERTGLWIRYHPRGTAASGGDGLRVAEAGEYAAGVRQGEWSAYRADGTLEQRGEYRDGLRQGAWEGYSASLLLAWSGDYDAGEKVGGWRTWYSEWTGGYIYAVAGTIATEETWVDGVRHGPFTHWFRGGGKEREGAYAQGVLGGVVTTWWEDGTKRFETTYLGGIAGGPHRQWDAEGRIEAEGRYEFGVPAGVWTFWSDPNLVIQFFGGPAARTRQSTTFVDGLAGGPVEGRYDADGALAFESQLVDGADEGPGTFYWPTGGVLAEGFYQGGAAQGPWQTYYESGAERATWPYVDNVLFGLFVEYHDNGQKKQEGTYNSGLRVGVWTSWDEAGVVTSSEDCGPGGAGCDCSLTEDCR
jgi:antitoxin component YwqK of YwqJK toxin-antitoxin module